MDLLSSRSGSNYTSISVDDELNDCNERYQELAAFYNKIICRNKTTKGIPTKRYQGKLDGNCNRTHLSHPQSNNKLNNIEDNKSRNLVINDRDKANPRNTTDRNKPEKHVSIQDIDTKIVDSNHANCSKNLPRNEVGPKLTFVKSSNKYEPHRKEDRTTGQVLAEKTTYCRPVLDMYSQEFIYKTMERNARLKGLVKRLVLAREKEKQKVAWNNYINELKNKHQNYSSEPSAIPNYVPEDISLDTIDDYYNTRFTWKQSNPCQNLLHDIYCTSNEIISDNNHRAYHVNRPLNFRPYIYDSSKYCFPTSSQGRLIMLNGDRSKYQLANQHNRSASRYDGIPIVVGKEDYPSTSKSYLKKNEFNKTIEFKKQRTIKSLSVQTDLNAFKDRAVNDYNTDETFKDKYDRVTSNVERLKQKIIQSQNEAKYCSLTSIENKLDVLINSINTFMVEIKLRKLSNKTKCEAVTCQLSEDSTHINTTKSDTFGILRQEEIVCGMVQERPRSTSAFDEGNRRGTEKYIEEILYEVKSSRAKRDIEDILNKPSRDRPSVHITFDIPTKERATEITDSLFKARHSNVVVEEIGVQENQMTIAVNTDPLGLLALFRVSAETVKQILSYMPHIDYYSYLSRLPLPQMSRNEMSHYVCNICGAAFGRPSQLSDHIQQHNTGNVRNCCVCRHVLDRQRHQAGLFSCRHCGQRFTRAYCRELHEQSCARSIGRSPDVTPSLLLLR